MKKGKIISISIVSVIVLAIIVFWGSVIHIVNTKLFELPIQKSIFVPTGAVIGAGAVTTNVPFTIGALLLLLVIIGLAIWGFSKLKK